MVTRKLALVGVAAGALVLPGQVSAASFSEVTSTQGVLASAYFPNTATTTGEGVQIYVILPAGTVKTEGSLSYVLSGAHYFAERDQFGPAGPTGQKVTVVCSIVGQLYNYDFSDATAAWAQFNCGDDAGYSALQIDFSIGSHFPLVGGPVAPGVTLPTVNDPTANMGVTPVSTSFGGWNVGGHTLAGILSASGVQYEAIATLSGVDARGNLTQIGQEIGSDANSNAFYFTSLRGLNEDIFQN
jgi:hypothetical protein